jgi:hypothetical protein
LTSPGAAVSVHRVRGILLDLEQTAGLSRGHPRRRLRALLDVVVGDDLLLLFAGEAGVSRQRAARQVIRP